MAKSWYGIQFWDLLMDGSRHHLWTLGKDISQNGAHLMRLWLITLASGIYFASTRNMLLAKGNTNITVLLVVLRWFQRMQLRKVVDGWTLHYNGLEPDDLI